MSCVSSGMERFSVDIPRASKKMCFRNGMWGCMEFVVAGWSKVKRFFDFLIESWFQWSVNISCDDLTLTEGVETKEIDY